MGIGLAAETVRVATTIRTKKTKRVAASSSRLCLRRIAAEAFLVDNQKALANPTMGGIEWRRAAANLDRADKSRPSSDEIDAEVTCLRLGPAVIASWPGELSCELGPAFKHDAPFAFPMVANLANGYVGYLLAARAYTKGGS